MAGLYLHIPFCKQACYYCDFHFSTDKRHIDEVISAMQHELELQKDFLSAPLETIYFGGGTPSVLGNEHLEALLRTARDLFPVAADPEITLEANPDDLFPAKLEQLRGLGINRLSIGVQSFRDDILQYLNRAHGAEAARRCLRESRAAGFQNISLDLIYAIPGLDTAMWMDTLKEALSFQPEHISLYSLTIEDRTVFGNRKKKGKLHAVEEELAARQFEVMQEVLMAEGYEHYEISNFARPGFYSRHNTSYWFQEPYLGIGPGAHSFEGSRRLNNIRNNALYAKSLAEAKLPAEVEWLSPENKINEYIITRLRTQWGCNLRTLRDQWQDDLLARRGPLIERYREGGLLTLSGDVLRLTRKGMLLADRLTEDLMKG